MMTRAYPLYRNRFPDYNGLMLKPYLKEKVNTMNKYIAEVNNSVVKPATMVESYKDRVLVLKKKGLTNVVIAEELSIGLGTVNRCLI